MLTNRPNLGQAPTDLTADGVRVALRSAADALAGAREVLDRLNVFPVPDGDTGVNLFLTLEAAAAAAEASEASSASRVWGDAAAEALARSVGNSGVIFGQWLKGLARGLEGEPANSAAIAIALEASATAANAAVTRPEAGTILDAMVSASEAARGGGSVSVRLRRAAAAALASARRSQDVLPAARAAGVPDAGALGFAVALDAIARSVAGRPPGRLPPWVRDLRPAADWRSQMLATHPAYGHCLQFTLASHVELKTLRRELATFTGSLLFAGEPPAIRVHLHTRDPEPALQAARRLGEVRDITSSSIDPDADLFLQPRVLTGVVAIVDGSGWRRLFEEFGALVVGTEEIDGLADRLATCAGEALVVLTNGLAAPEMIRNALKNRRRSGRILACPDQPRGLAALLQFDAGEDARANLRAMREAARRVHVLEAEDARAATLKARRRPDSMLTIHPGANASEEEVSSLLAAVRAMRGQSVECAPGGQSQPRYWLAFEA